MKLTIEPSEQHFVVGGVKVRAWQGHDEGGTPVTALVAGVQFEGENAEAEQRLVSIPPPHPEAAKHWAWEILTRHEGALSLEPGPPDAVWLPLVATPAIQAVLGLMIFRTGPIAHVYQAAGYDIPRKAEAEQAFVLFRFLRLAILHGEEWGKYVDADLDAAIAAAKARVAARAAPQ